MSVAVAVNPRRTTQLNHKAESHRLRPSRNSDEEET
jgi:hypothetical protein